MGLSYCGKVGVSCVLLVFVVSSVCLVYQNTTEQALPYNHPPIRNEQGVIRDPNIIFDIHPTVANKLKQISEDLALIHRKPGSSAARLTTISAMKKIYEVLRIFEIDVENKTLNKKTPSLSKSVCPETYSVKNGYSMTQCDNTKPLQQVITILLNFINVTPDKQKEILSGIEAYHEKIRVAIAVQDAENSFYSNYKLSINQHQFPSGSKGGEIWNKLVSSVRTPFVLVGRNIDLFTSDARLERLVREIELLDTPLVGGATRTPDGHWNMACSQVAYKNFTIAYHSGYRLSQHECVYCDFVSGPFMAKTDYLQKHKFKKNLEESVLFEDYMMQMYVRKERAIVCPDSMYHVTAESGIERERSVWIPFAKEWKLNRLRLSSGVLHKFTEKEAGLTCYKTSGRASPIQCLQYLADGVKVTMRVCEEQNIICELRAGTVLGTIKFGSVIPWERDADVGFLSNEANYTAHKNMIGLMKREGYTMKERGNKRYHGSVGYGEFDISITGWRLETYGFGEMDTEDLLKRGLRPTKTILDGQWVNVPRNPGLYVRNKFGYEVYRHQEHVPTYLGPKYFYHPGSAFRKCPSRGSQDCLDQYNADGNLQFGEPSP